MKSGSSMAWQAAAELPDDDRDETAFCRDVTAGIERLARAIGGELKPDTFTRTGVTSEERDE